MLDSRPNKLRRFPMTDDPIGLQTEDYELGGIFSFKIYKAIPTTLKHFCISYGDQDIVQSLGPITLVIWPQFQINIINVLVSSFRFI